MSYDRRYTLSVNGKPFVVGGSGRQIRINFTISVSFNGFQSTGDIAIYNMANDTIEQNLKPGDTVALSAGYTNNEGGIFAGEITYVLRERNGPDTVTRILALSSSRTERLIDQTFPVNTTAAEVIKACADAAGFPLDWTQAEFDDEPLYTSGLTLPGVDALEQLKMLSERHNFYVLVDNSALTVVKHGSSRKGAPIIISEQTGMEGIPELTWHGVDVATRLNPGLAIGKQFEVKGYLQTFNMANFYYSEIPRGAGRGTYNIYKIEHEGDNWGDEWTSKVTGYTASV